MRFSGLYSLPLAAITWVACLQSSPAPIANAGGGSAAMSSSISSSPPMSSSATGTAPPCRSNTDCPSSMYCEFEDHLCGTTFRWGGCVFKAEQCQLGDGRPVCACDGKVYESVLCAEHAGFDLATDTSYCELSGSLFSCGDLICDSATEFCRRWPLPNFPKQTYDECVPYGGSCSSDRTCACVDAGDPCPGACSVNGAAMTVRECTPIP